MPYVPYRLRVYKCLETSRFISLTPAAVKVQFLILVFSCIIATGVNDFFHIFFPFI
nr:MAG TPA: hypothetical protein [Caudoviricetes sp.]